MDIKYSDTAFEGYTHTFTVKVKINKTETITIYSNNGNKDKLDKYLNAKKAGVVKSITIESVIPK